MSTDRSPIEQPRIPGPPTSAPSLQQRAARHAALGETVRLAIVDDLRVTDRSPKELAERFGLPGNLLAHHLDVLEAAGLIRRFVSSGDRRRRYVRLVRPPETPQWSDPDGGRGRMLFVCTHNSARSQLAAAMWRARTGHPADSAGTHPADRVHPGAIRAGRRVGLDLSGALPRTLQEGEVEAAELATLHSQVVTVCDRAHEELEPSPRWWHWSIPDPVDAGTDAAFDDAIADLERRIRVLTETVLTETVLTDRAASSQPSQEQP